MFNPSKADETDDDPTIRRVMGFARREKYTIVEIVNLIPFITPKPSNLNSNTAFGNSQYIDYLKETLLNHDRIVAAWGAIGDRYPEIFITALRKIAHQMEKESFYSGKFFSLGTTDAGHPRHPLYINGNQPLESFDLYQYLRQHNAFN